MFRKAILIFGSAPLVIVPIPQRQPEQAADLLRRVDHLVYATPDLDAGIARIERQLGVRAVIGGSHPGRGTRNALVALGSASYLEIIGPDPAQPAPEGGRPFRIDTLTAPSLVAWAAKGERLEDLAAAARRGGVGLGEVIAGRRARPDGVVLTWRYTDPKTVVADGLVPFFIDWGASPHPATSAAPGARLVDLRAEHPDPDAVLRVLRAIEIPLHVDRGPAPALIATIAGPRGRVELR
jgi:glyoxalase-like protein